MRNVFHYPLKCGNQNHKYPRSLCSEIIQTYTLQMRKVFTNLLVAFISQNYPCHMSLLYSTKRQNTASNHFISSQKYKQNIAVISIYQKHPHNH